MAVEDDEELAGEGGVGMNLQGLAEVGDSFIEAAGVEKDVAESGVGVGAVGIKGECGAEGLLGLAKKSCGGAGRAELGMAGGLGGGKGRSALEQIDRGGEVALLEFEQAQHLKGGGSVGIGGEDEGVRLGGVMEATGLVVGEGLAVNLLMRGHREGEFTVDGVRGKRRAGGR